LTTGGTAKRVRKKGGRRGQKRSGMTGGEGRYSRKDSKKGKKKLCEGGGGVLDESFEGARKQRK